MFQSVPVLYDPVGLLAIGVAAVERCGADDWSSGARPRSDRTMETITTRRPAQPGTQPLAAPGVVGMLVACRTSTATAVPTIGGGAGTACGARRTPRCSPVRTSTWKLEFSTETNFELRPTDADLDQFSGGPMIPAVASDRNRSGRTDAPILAGPPGNGKDHAWC